MQTIGDLVAEGRERDGDLFRRAEGSTPFGYEATCTNAWKVAHLLRHYGVREGERVAVVVGPKTPDGEDEPGRLGDAPTPLVAVLGAALDGAVVDVDPPGVVDATVLVAPTAWLDRYGTGPGTKPVAYGGPPDDPVVAHLEGEAWSENPLAPPTELAPTDPVLAADELYAHGDLLAASRRVVADADLTADDRVRIDAPVTHPGTLVAGLLAPMRVGATILLGDATDATVVVGDADGSATAGAAERAIDPDDAAPS